MDFKYKVREFVLLFETFLLELRESCHNYDFFMILMVWVHILKVLRGLLEKIFRTCHQTSARSLAMPLIGTGKHEFPEDVLLRLMKEEIESFSAIYPRSTLKEIKLVRYDKGRGYDKYTKRDELK